MDYQNFIRCLLTELQSFYGEKADIATRKILKNNGQSYLGLQILLNKEERTVPVANLDEYYEKYRKGGMQMEDCIQEIRRLRERYGNMEDILQFADSIRNWEKVRENVYPVLLAAETNQELLQLLVSTPMLDLSIIYIVRGERGEYFRLTKEMLEIYGIDKHVLHNQALANLEKDNYKFLDMNDIFGMVFCGFRQQGMKKKPKMYVLTNGNGMYGAAGILNKQLLRKFAGIQNFFILPASVHETIFVPANGEFERWELDSMVAEINQRMVDKEERLPDHSYYYDVSKDEIRICA